MKIHRFYTPDEALIADLWLKNQYILNQWNRVLRFRPGQQVVLFDGQGAEGLYKLVDIQKDEANLQLITHTQPTSLSKNVYLFWSLLKKDKNDWVLQKCTELGVSHFIPMLADRSEKTGFNLERAQKIVIEAAEQCGRSDIPNIRDVMHVSTALEQYGNKISILACQQGSNNMPEITDTIGVLVGPEGGWSEVEKTLFEQQNVKQWSIHQLTLRAETACVAAVAKLL